MVAGARKIVAKNNKGHPGAYAEPARYHPPPLNGGLFIPIPVNCLGCLYQEESRDGTTYLQVLVQAGCVVTRRRADLKPGEVSIVLR